MRLQESAVDQSKKPRCPTSGAARGFSLLELLVAMAVFLFVSAAAFSLFSQHAKIVVQQQNLSGVNIGLRNAMSQMEMDLSGAGQDLLGSVNGNVPTFSLGVLVNNSVPGTATACTANTTNWSYPIPSACFDSLTIVAPKPCTTAGGTIAPVLAISDPSTPSPQPELLSGTTIWGTDANSPNVAATATSDATCYKQGDELLLVYFPVGSVQPTCDNGQFNYCMGIITLTADATANSAGRIQLSHNPTSSSTDPLGIIYRGGSAANFTKAKGINFSYPNGSTYIVNLGNGANDITYAVQVNTANANDPQLLRCSGASCTGSNGQVLTDQVIGFKIGAALWDNAQAGATDIANYFYDSTKYCNDAVNGTDCTVASPPANDQNDFTLVRAVRISIVGRTPPRTQLAQYNFKNGFDNGPYLVQQASVVVDLRNLSMNDFGN